jgi:hypothetical protein
MEKRTTHSKISRRKEIIKITAKINEWETKEQYNGSVKQRASSLKGRTD